jgi:hypothetical protein
MQEELNESRGDETQRPHLASCSDHQKRCQSTGSEGTSSTRRSVMYYRSGVCSIRGPSLSNP